MNETTIVKRKNVVVKPNTRLVNSPYIAANKLKPNIKPVMYVTVFQNS